MKLGDLRAHRVDDAPAASECAESNGAVRRQHDPERDVERFDVAGREQHTGDNPHRLLRVVGAVIETEECGRQQLQPAEPAVDAGRRRPAEDPLNRRHQQQARRQTDERREKDEDDRLGPAARDERRETGLRDSGARIATNQRMRRARRQAEVPRDQVPDDGARRPAEDDREGHDLDIDHPGPHGPGHGGPERECGDEVEERRPDYRFARRQDARRHDGRNRIGGVVKTVDVVEEERDRDETDDGQEHR